MAELEKPKMQFLQRNQKNYSNPDLNTKSAVNFDRTFFVYWILLIGVIFLNEINADKIMAIIKGM